MSDDENVDERKLPMQDLNSNATASSSSSSYCYSNCFCGFFSPVIPLVGGRGPAESMPVYAVKVTSNQRIDKSHWICDYSDDIFQTLRETELKRRQVCFRSQQKNYRPMLLRLLKVATEAHKLARTTLHLAVYLLDCFMDNYTIRVDKLNLTAITCLIVAAKIEEADMDMPKFAELNKFVGDAYTLPEFKNVEFKVLATFDFETIRPTAATFAEYFSNSFVTLEDYHVYLRQWHSGALNYPQTPTAGTQPISPPLLLPLYTSYEEMLTSLSKLLFELIDVSLSYMRFANARPSIIASACIAAVRRLRSVTPVWTPFLVQLTKCTEDVITPFVEAIIALHKLQLNKERVAQQPVTPLNGVGASATTVLCDSPDSGIVSCDAKSNTSDEESDEDDDNDEEEEEEEDEAYTCLEYPLLAKRRRLF